MASSTFLTIPTAFTSRTTPCSVVSRVFPAEQRRSLRVNALAQKWEPTKVVPQADRVLVRLEQLPEVLLENYLKKDTQPCLVLRQGSFFSTIRAPASFVEPDIRLLTLAAKSAGGVLLPKSAVKFERYLMGEILSVGADAGEVGAGKKVLFSDISAYEVELGTDAKHCFVKAGDLLAVVE